MVKQSTHNRQSAGSIPARGTIYLGITMKKDILKAVRGNLEARIRDGEIRIAVLLANPTVIPDHMNITESIEQELERMADATDKLAILEKHFE